MNKSSFLVSLLGLASVAYTQQRVPPIDTHVAADATRTTQAPAASAYATGFDYVLGTGDTVSIFVPDLGADDQFTPDKTFRIDGSGNLILPFVGQVHAAGLTTQALGQEIEAALAGKILKHPQAVVTITQFNSQPVSVYGEVTVPGLHQLVGGKNLFDALSLAGGLSEHLGNTITITRNLKWGPIPLPNAHDDPSGQFCIASLNVKSLLKVSDPSHNIPLMPEDVITVSRSEVVYAVGSLNSPGGFELGQNESLSTLQVIALAQGLNRTAAADRAIILRALPGSKTRTQIPVNVKQLMAGNGTDLPLQADDILFIPNSKSKSAAYRTLDIIGVSTSAAIYRF